ncbi:unnamed protein product, partial [Closterium sp. NIES-54]
SLPPLPRSLAPACLPCVEGRQRVAPHSSSFPPTTAPLQTLHVDSKANVCGVLIHWIRTVCLQLRARFREDLPVLRLHSDRGGEFISRLLEDSCRVEGIVQSYMLSASPHQNGSAECRIGLVMEVARTSMMHAAALYFLWPFAVRYAAEQLNLLPHVSHPKTSPTLQWTGEVGDASAFQVWGSLSFVRDLPAGKLSPRNLRCVFLGSPTDAPPWQFYFPGFHHVLSSRDVAFDESVCFNRLHPHHSSLVPLPPLSLVDNPPPTPLAQLRGVTRLLPTPWPLSAPRAWRSLLAFRLDRLHRLRGPSLWTLVLLEVVTLGVRTLGVLALGVMQVLWLQGVLEVLLLEVLRVEVLVVLVLVLVVLVHVSRRLSRRSGFARRLSIGEVLVVALDVLELQVLEVLALEVLVLVFLTLAVLEVLVLEAQVLLEEYLSPERLHEWSVRWGSPGGGAGRAGAAGSGAASPRGASAGVPGVGRARGASAVVPQVGGTGGANTGGATGGTRFGGASRQESLSPQQLRAWAVRWGSPGGGAGGAGSGGVVPTGTCGFGGVTTQPQHYALRHLLSLPPAATEFPNAGTTPPLLFPPTHQS